MQNARDLDTLSAPALNREQRRARTRRRAAALGSAAVLASGTAAIVTGTTGVASANAYTVTNCDDSGPGSLRKAIEDSNTNFGGALDTITITATCTASSPVAVGSRMEVTDDLAIVGPGPASFVLDGGGATQIIYVDSERNLSVSGVTFQNGDGASDSGGAIYIDDGYDIVITDVVFLDNTTTATGGALFIDSSHDVTITDSTFVGNHAGSQGGAFYLLYSDGEAVISNSTFEGNSSDGDGGAIAIYEQPGDVSIYNTTITGNTSGDNGGGIALTGLYYDITLGFVTIADNTAAGLGGGLYSNVQDNETITIFGSIFSGNVDGGGANEVYNDTNPVTTYNNLFEGPVVGFTADASDLTGVDPLLAPLADNGGPTQTRALGAGSPAIDAGPSGWPTFAGDLFDQRGTPYVRGYGGVADIGAYEAQPGPTPPEPTPEPAPEPSFTG